MPAPSARFDDLISQRSFRLDDLSEELAAFRSDDVIPVICAAEQHAAAGRWVAVAMSYEAAPGFDGALVVRDPDPTLPLVWCGVFDRSESVPAPAPVPPPDLAWETSIEESAHRQAISRIRDLIGAGVTYQANFTHRLLASFNGAPGHLYAAMLAAQRPAYGALLEFGDHAVVSASPELFFSLAGNRVVTRPMKGTAARGRWIAEDDALREALAASAKDRAENLMIVDLLRNDLGRIARFGSVRVESLFDIEPFETVWQMTTTIAADRRPDADLAALFGALFPCGSVTGAPKASTMEIIAELETAPRGAYCGAIGFIEPGAGRACFSVGIRTAVVDRAAGLVTYGTGGGITWDSRPDGEWREAAAKAAVLRAPRPRFDLLETLRLDESGYYELDRHLSRLAGSARYFRRPYDEDRVTAPLAAVTPPPEPLRVRLTVDPDGAPAVTVAALPEDAGPVRLAVDRTPIDRSDVFRFHKTTHRTAYDDAAARFPDADDVVAVNDRGEVVETTIGNLLVRIGNEWRTPPVSAGCLPGIERERLLEAGEVREVPVTIEELMTADEIHVINSVRLRRRAVLIEG